METKINIAELLKDCPKGMELDSSVYENLTYDYVNQEQGRIYCKLELRDTVWFTIYGRVNLSSNAKCVIFPKGQTTWEEFQRPFKDGDILATDLGSVFFLNTRLNSDEHYGCYVGIGGDGSFHICAPFAYKECCGLATEEEKQKLFKAIKDNGYRWNTETKTLEKLVEPKFKVGDRIRHCRVEGSNIYRVVKIEKSKYVVHKNIGECDYHVDFEVQDDWELVPNKFDITTLKPFERVLTRVTTGDVWGNDFFGYYKDRWFHCSGHIASHYCIPFEGNEHLLGTTNDCDDYYKTWK